MVWFLAGAKDFSLLHSVPVSQSPNHLVSGILFLKIKWLGCEVITNLYLMPELRMNGVIPLLPPHTFMESMSTPLILHLQNGQYKNNTITSQTILLIWSNTLSSDNISLFHNSKKKTDRPQSHGKINFITVTGSNIRRDCVKTCHLKIQWNSWIELLTLIHVKSFICVECFYYTFTPLYMSITF